MDPAAVDLDIALGLLALPRDIGPHPETGEMIQAGIGRFGPYIKHEGTYVSLKEDDVLAIGHNRAVELLANAPRKPAPVTIGDHPDDGKPIILKTGRWGPYVQHGKTRATLPKDKKEETPTLEEAVALIAAKGGAPKKKTRKAARKSSAKKTGARKTNAKKSAQEGAQGPGAGRRRLNGAGRFSLAERKKPKAGLPSRQDILDYISENPDHATVRDIISAFNVAKKYRARLRSEIRHLKDMGLIEDGGDRSLSRTGALPPVTVVRVSGTDRDGEVLVTPDNWPEDLPAPLVYLKADRRPGPAPGLGDRLLVRLRRQDDGDYQARLIRALPGGSPLVIGVYDGDARVKPTDRKARSELEIGPGDGMDAEAGELVVAELVRHGSRYGLRQARIVRRIGRFGAAETFSRAALGANDVPVEFTSEALALAEAAIAAPPGRACRSPWQSPW